MCTPLKDEAVTLRLAGMSYNDIFVRLRVPKSTLSYWFRDLRESDAIRKRNTNARRAEASEAIRAYNKERAKIAFTSREASRQAAAAEIVTLSLDQLRLVGTALYWGEGYRRSPWNFIFCNTDPLMIQTMMRFLREIRQVPEIRMKPQVQVHHVMESVPSAAYWSLVTGIPARKFSKPLLQTSRSSKKKVGHRLPYGTFRIRINDVRLVSQIHGWILGLSRAGSTGAWPNG